MDPQTAYFIVSSCRGRSVSSTRKVSPYFESLQQAVRALSFLRERRAGNERLHIEQGDRQLDTDA